MSNFALVGLLIALAITVLVAVGYFFGPPIWKRTPPQVRRPIYAVGHVLLFLMWGLMLYRLMERNHWARTWECWLSLTLMTGLAYLTVKRVVRTLTSPDESFGRGSHA